MGRAKRKANNLPSECRYSALMGDFSLGRPIFLRVQPMRLLSIAAMCTWLIACSQFGNKQAQEEGKCPNIGALVIAKGHLARITQRASLTAEKLLHLNQGRGRRTFLRT